MEKEDDGCKGEGAAKYGTCLRTLSTALRIENNFQVFKGFP